MACTSEMLAFLRMQPPRPKPSSSTGTLSQGAAGAARATRPIPDAFQLEGSTSAHAGTPAPRRV
eukprot:11545628-Heterocapsa_arctica.AAC.1